MSAITTHILDVSTGAPAHGVTVVLERQFGGDWQVVGAGATDEDGRMRDLLDPEKAFETGFYRLTFETGTYFANKHIECFYPYVMIVFAVEDASQHYHVPLLLSPFGYSTYRGS